jgi:hypothetical protein
MDKRKSCKNTVEKASAGIVARRVKNASNINNMKIALKEASGVEVSDGVCEFCIRVAFKSVFGKEEYAKIIGKGVEDVGSGYISEDSVRRVVESAIARRK